MRRLKLLALAAVPAAVLGGWAAGVFGPSRPADPPPADPGGPRFEDVAGRAGVLFRHFDPATPLHLIPETIGSGVAWVDYDADGWPDLFWVQDGPLPPAPAPNPRPGHKLYRNNRDGTFADVTEAAGVPATGYGTGVAVGDYDNDGFDDLVVTHLGDGVRLFHNEPAGNGGRRFADVSAGSGLGNPHFGTSCGWADVDGDGLLDLYVCNYVEVDPANPVACRHPDKGVPVVCNPTAHPLAAHKLFRNLGGGKFADVSRPAGIAAAPPAAGLGVVLLDVDADGRPDVYAANDLGPAYLFRNTGGGAFAEVGLPSGCALGLGGARMAGMGVAAADVDGSGRPSLWVTNFQNAPSALFLNRGGRRFTDASTPSGLGPASLARLGFGNAFLDADGDGDLDAAVANGHVARNAAEVYGAPYAQPAQVFVGDGRGKFRDVSAAAGPDVVRPRVGRGLAAADFDNDGRPDLALSGVGEPAAVLRNVSPAGNAWVNLELIGDGKRSNRNAVGAVVRVEWGGRARTHFVAGGGSYLSASDRRLALGLGPGAGKLDKATVTWPSGRVQEFRGLAAGAFWRLHEGRPDPERVR